MKEYIVRNEEKITQVQSSMALLSQDLDGVEDELSSEISSLSTTLTESIFDINSTVERNSA